MPMIYRVMIASVLLVALCGASSLIAARLLRNYWKEDK